METVETRKIVVLGLVLLVISNALVEKTEAKFNPLCFVTCIGACALFKNPFICAGDCAIKCLIGPKDISTPEARKEESSDFCQLGCAISSCTPFIKRENPGTSQNKFPLLVINSPLPPPTHKYKINLTHTYAQ